MQVAIAASIKMFLRYALWEYIPLYITRLVLQNYNIDCEFITPGPFL